MELDAIILSKTINLSYYGMLHRTVNTLRIHNPSVKINTIVVESNKDAIRKEYLIPNSITIVPEESFNYNKFLNYGLSKSRSEHVLICNNDLIFRKNSVLNLLTMMQKHNLDSVCPIEPNYHRNHGYLSEADFKLDYVLGYEVQKHVVGWCICTRRSLIDEMGGFDERFLHWYQDNDYAMWLKTNQKSHGLIPSSRVYHMFQKSLSLIPNKKALTDDLLPVFEEKWGLKS